MNNLKSMESWQKATLGLGCVVILLLATSNVMLYALLQDSKSSDAATASEPTVAKIPELSNSGKGSSSKELLKELDNTQKQIKRPLDQALFSLDSLGSTAATLEDFRAQFDSVAATTEEFASTAPELRAAAKRTKRMQRQFNQVSDFVYGLGPLLTEWSKNLKQIQSDVAQIKACDANPSQCG